VLIIFAATSGHFDQVDVAAIGGLERELYRFVDTRHPAVLSEIAEKKTLDDGLKNRMHEVLKEFIREHETQRAA
jgi:F-type H+-transporting ATPase subunit alpha